jgi:hypothetical protein
MTHDELLAKLEYDGIEPWDYSIPTSHKAVAALRAVVELHKPISDNSCYDPGCCGGPYPDLCGICSEHYPCETIEAIEKELG